MEAASPLTLDGYVRVSQVRGRAGDSFISPTVQRDRIQAWASAFGHNIAVVHEELDVSGARADRPELLTAIERVERGETQGIVVAKLDRFARSLIDGLRLIDRIQKAGGTFVSVADGLDLTTDTGRLVLRIMLSLAEFELDRVRGNWQDAKTRAVMRGIHPSASPPFGYTREGRGGPLIIDEKTAPVVRELFERRARGAGPTELADWLNGTGARTQRGNTFSHRAVKDILRNDVYVGVASSGEVRNETAHDPLIDHRLFQSVQWKGVQIRPRSEEPSPIRPLLRCAGCRYAMRAESRVGKDGHRYWYFTCRSTTGRVAWRCEQPAAIRDDGALERLIVERFFEDLPLVQAKARAANPRLEGLDARIADATTAFAQWRDDHRIQNRHGMDVYLDGLSARQDTMNSLLAERAAESMRAGQVDLPVDVGDLRHRWDGLAKVRQRDLLASVYRCVFVRGSRRPAPPEGRVWFVTHDEPVELPSRGDRNWVARPFVFDD